METKNRHPADPPSNVPMLAGFDPNNYLLDERVPMTVLTDESLTPGRPPCLTQRTIGMYLQPLTRELTLCPPRPTVKELPDAVKDQMVLKDKAFWVDKPGANAYTLHDAYYDYQMTSKMVKPVHQDVFPRSYQYDLDCVRYRRTHGCDGLKQSEGEKKIPLKAYCRDCNNKKDRGLTPFQVAWAQDPGQRRWRDYPDVSATLTAEEIRASMDEYAFIVKKMFGRGRSRPPRVMSQTRRARRTAPEHFRTHHTDAAGDGPLQAADGGSERPRPKYMCLASAKSEKAHRHIA